MPDPSPPVIEWSSPPTPCDEDDLRSPILRCNGMGEWVPDWVNPEGAGLIAESILPPTERCGGCDSAILDAFRLGASVFRDGIELGRSLSQKPLGSEQG